MSDNEHVAPLLLGDRKMPRRLPAYISWGGKDEAVAYVHGAVAGWAAADGALAWLRAHKERCRAAALLSPDAYTGAIRLRINALSSRPAHRVAP